MLELWHNPRCSKSRQALALLEEAGVAFRLRRYLEDAPDATEIAAARQALGLPLIGMVRTGEALFRELGLSRDTAEPQLLEAMAAHPILIERPIALKDGRGVIGRPPERLRDLL